eukprot:TRINITY_DN17592_c2_g1_i1.p1 TRINITY_DN17592_c2_g1~~TRINITY_DN17592_c2_g1_i1.p1  ORF type:complete len:1170 (+),score=288.66 TRINITY_DN17592_c2_g1_i1:84-3593(+)
MDLESKMLQGFMATAGKQPSAQRQQQQQIHGGLPQQQFAAPAGWPQGAPYPQMVQQQGMMQPGMMGQGYYPQQHFGGHYMPQQQHAQPQQQGLAAMFAKQKQKELLSLQKGRMLEQQRQAAAIIAQDDFGDFAGGSSLPPPQASQQPAAAEVPDDDFGDFATAPSASAPAAPAPPPQDDSDEFADFQAAAPAVPSVQQPAPPPQPTLLHSDPAVIVSPPPLPSDAAPEAAEGAAEAAGAPSAAPVDRRAAAVSDVRRTTGMTETYARFSLEAAKWDVAEALRLFRLKKASLPAEAFDPAPPPQQQPPPDHTPRQEQPQFPQPAHTSARSASQLSASSFPEDDRSGLGSGAAGTEPPPLPQLAGSPLWPSQQLPPSPPARSPQLTAAAPTTSPTAIGRRLAELEAAKAAAIAREDFDEAKRIKLEVDAIRSQSQPPPSPTGGPPETFVLRRATAAERLGFHLGEDLRLAACADDSPAARAGLRRALGGLLVSINGTPVSSLAECAGHMRELELSLSIRMPPPPRPPSPAAAAAGPAPVGAGAAAGEDDDDFADFQGPAPTPAPAEASNGRQPPDGTADPAHRQPAEHSFEPPPLPSASPPSAPRQPPSTNGAPPPLPSQEADSEFTSWSGAPAHAEWGGEVLPGAATASAATADDGVAPSVGSGMILSDVYHCGKRAAKQPPASAVAAGLRRLCASDDEDSGAEFADFQAAAPSPPPAAPAQPAPLPAAPPAAAAAQPGLPPPEATDDDDDFGDFGSFQVPSAAAQGPPQPEPPQPPPGLQQRSHSPPELRGASPPAFQQAPPPLPGDSPLYACPEPRGPPERSGPSEACSPSTPLAAQGAAEAAEAELLPVLQSDDLMVEAAVLLQELQSSRRIAEAVRLRCEAEASAGAAAQENVKRLRSEVAQLQRSHALLRGDLCRASVAGDCPNLGGTFAPTRLAALCALPADDRQMLEATAESFRAGIAQAVAGDTAVALQLQAQRREWVAEQSASLLPRLRSTRLRLGLEGLSRCERHVAALAVSAGAAAAAARSPARSAQPLRQAGAWEPSPEEAALLAAPNGQDSVGSLLLLLRLAAACLAAEETPDWAARRLAAATAAASRLAGAAGVPLLRPLPAAGAGHQAGADTGCVVQCALSGVEMGPDDLAAAVDLPQGSMAYAPAARLWEAING